jgi:hypothetical protein
MCDGFTRDEMATLIQAANAAFERVISQELDSVPELEGHIYTHIRRELAYLNNSLARKFSGQYRKLTCRLNKQEKREFQMICDMLTKRHILSQDDAPATISGLRLTLASAEAAVKAAEVAAHRSIEIGEKLSKLEQELEQQRR